MNRYNKTKKLCKKIDKKTTCTLNEKSQTQKIKYENPGNKHYSTLLFDKRHDVSDKKNIYKATNVDCDIKGYNSRILIVNLAP